MPTSPIPAPAVTNLQYASDQLFGTEDPGLAKSNLIYALEQLGIYVPPGASEPEPEVIIPPAPIDSGGDSYVPPTDSGSDEPFSPTAENYQDYLTGQRDVVGMLAGGAGPIGNLAVAGMDYNMGYNPVAAALTDDNEGFTDPLGDYRGFYNENYSGPGHDYAVSVGLTPGTEQYDQVVTSMGYDVESESQKDKGLFGGFINNPFESRTFNYDPDMDMKGFDSKGREPISIKDFTDAYSGKSKSEEYVISPDRGTITDITNVDSYTNPYAGEDLGSPFSDDSLGVTNNSYESNNDGTGVFTSDEVGAVDVTEYGNNQFGVDLGGPDEVGIEAPPSDSAPTTGAPSTFDPGSSDYSPSDDFGGDSFGGTGGTDVTGATESDYSEHDNPDESTGPSDSGGGDSGGSSSGGCFIDSTLVTDAEGKDRAIVDFKIGDKVMSADGKSVNTVTYIEEVSWNDNFVIYSPDSKHKPFITQNHPVIVNNEWVSADIDYTQRNHPWIDAKEIESPVVKRGKGITVYNLWVDGDNTYTVNGYGTETLLGDGGVVRQGLEHGNITMDDFMTIVNSSKEAEADVTYGMHILNDWLSVINNKKYNKFILDSVLGKRKGTVIKTMIKTVGSIAVALTPRLWNKNYSVMIKEKA